MGALSPRPPTAQSQLADITSKARYCSALLQRFTLVSLMMASHAVVSFAGSLLEFALLVLALLVLALLVLALLG